MTEEKHSEDELKQDCICCNRTGWMIDILNDYFSKNITLKNIGLYEGPICSECFAELQQIVFEQVYYGDNKIKLKDLKEKCLAILFNRDHLSGVNDEELCLLFLHFNDVIGSLKRRKKFTIDDLNAVFQAAYQDWNTTHPHKCFVAIEPADENGTKLNIYIRLTLSPSKTEGFAVKMEMCADGSKLDTDDVIPFKVD